MTTFDLSGPKRPQPTEINVNGKIKVELPKTTKPKIPELIKSKNEDELVDTKFDWDVKKLQSIKKKLNEVKSTLDIINSNKRGSKAYNYIVRESGFYENLRGTNGSVVQKYNAEIATNAWLKFWEILNEFFSDSFQHKNKHDPELKSFHVAEAPGNFIVCLNHFLSDLNNISWQWMAESYVPDSNLGTLGDDYGIIKKFRNKWVLGIEENGDICSSANIRSFSHELPKKIGYVNFYTGDGKIETTNYAEEEKTNIRILYGQILCCLKILQPGGDAVIKMFTTYETPTICILYLMRLVFWELYIYKPKTSRGANSEVYLIAKDYRGIAPSILSKLLNWFDGVSDQIIQNYGIFKYDDVDEDFIDLITNMSIQLAKSQKKHLDRNYEIYKKYAETDNLMQLIPDMEPVREKCANKWLEHNKMKTLPLDKCLLLD
jgi:hypothetical protein